MRLALGIVPLLLVLGACTGARPHPRGPEGIAGPQGPETSAPDEKAAQGQPALPEEDEAAQAEAEGMPPEEAEAAEKRAESEAGVLGTDAPPVGLAREVPQVADHDPDLRVVAELDQGPGNVTVTPDGRVVVSLHPFYEPDLRVATVEGGELVPFPNPEWSLGSEGRTPRLDAVLGVQSDPQGVVWMLDTGMRGGTEPQLVAWDTKEWTLAHRFGLGAVTRDTSFVNDLVVDLDHGHVYIADPAGGEDAALIVVDVATGEARRLLQGHESVVPEDVDLFVEGRPVRRKQPDGSVKRPRIGVDPIAADADNAWLYFGPMHGTTLWRVRTADLRDPSLSEDELASRVQRFADKPLCDGISMDVAGNVYVSDLARDAIGVIAPDGAYELLVQDARLSWPDAFSFGPDGRLYTVANQLHRSAALNAGVSVAEPPFLLISVSPLADGTTGR